MKYSVGGRFLAGRWKGKNLIDVPAPASVACPMPEKEVWFRDMPLPKVSVALLFDAELQSMVGKPEMQSIHYKHIYNKESALVRKGDPHRTIPHDKSHERGHFFAKARFTSDDVAMAEKLGLSKEEVLAFKTSGVTEKEILAGKKPKPTSDRHKCRRDRASLRYISNEVDIFGMFVYLK